MITVRPSQTRGHLDHGWLDTYHTFSFGSYYNPRQMGFRSLRVINEDRVAPGQGFGMHGHQDMEIVTLVLSGALEHRDSLGNGEVLHPDELQRMTAGSGIRHSEFNPSSDEPAHLYQIWLLPDEAGRTPSYEQKRFEPAARDGRWQLVASPAAEDGALAIHQDARLWRARLAAGQDLDYELAAGRGAWLQVLAGQVELAGETLVAGDGAALDDERRLQVKSTADAELLLFDLK